MLRSIKRWVLTNRYKGVSIKELVLRSWCQGVCISMLGAGYYIPLSRVWLYLFFFFGRWVLFAGGICGVLGEI